MAHIVPPGSGSNPVASGKPPATVPSSHNVFVTLLGEVIGVSILAIIADANNTLGKIAVALMAGWLLLFLISNATDLSNLAGKL